MARKVRFALKLKDDYEARQGIEEIREHFDLEKILGYLHDGRLVQWLRMHHAEREADELDALDHSAKDLPAQVCKIFGIKIGMKVRRVNSQEVFLHNSKRQKLEQYTADETLLEKSDFAAFDDKDLRELIKEGKHTIVLCHGTFHIPLNAQDIKYIMVSKVELVIDSKRPVDFKKKKIRFIGKFSFDSAYQTILKLDADVKKAIEKKAKRKRKDNWWCSDTIQTILKIDAGVKKAIEKKAKRKRKDNWWCSDTI